MKQSIRLKLGLAALLSGLSLSPQVWSGCIDAVQLNGVNLAGAEFNSAKLPGRLGFDYVYPAKDDIAYFSSAGMNVIRLPILWERIQPQLGAPLAQSELDNIRQVGSWAAERGMCVILDLHNYGKFRGEGLGTPNVPASALADVWKRLHAAFPEPQLYAYGLMNEPAAVSVRTWMSVAQETVLALRSAGSNNLVLVGSGRWSGAHEWEKEFDGTSASRAFSEFIDPRDRYAIELHQYADAYFSGTAQDCIDPARMRQILGVVTQWANAKGRKLFLGEFGVAATPACLAALEAALASMADPKVWRGWAYWSAGRWWGNYPFSVQPSGGRDAAQMVLLRKFARRPNPPGDVSITSGK